MSDGGDSKDASGRQASGGGCDTDGATAGGKAEVLQLAVARMRGRSRCTAEGLLLWRTSLMSAVRSEGRTSRSATVAPAVLLPYVLLSTILTAVPAKGSPRFRHTLHGC